MTPARIFAVAIAAYIVLVVAFLIVWHRSRDGFVSQRAREVRDASAELFAKTKGAATYGEFRAAIPDADPVVYTDTRDLWRAGRLTPENVQHAL